MEQSYRPDKDLRDATVIISSSTTSAGNVGGTTLIDTALTQAESYWVNMAVVILSGNSIGQIRRISAFTAATDTVTVDTAFATQIASGTKYNIVAQHVTTSGGGDATAANQTLILADMGDASGSTLTSLYAILGNPATAISTDIATIKGDTQTIEDSTLKAAPTAGSLARFIASGGTALGTQLPDSKSLYDCLSGGVTTVDRVAGKTQVLEVSITVAANAGATTVATVTTQPCLIKSIVTHADTAQTADLTSCAVTGGASGVVTFISTADATQANLNAADKQVAWTGAVRLAATKTIVITPAGTGATALDLTITIEYESCVNGGYLA